MSLIHKMGKTVGYPLKPLLVIYTLRATLLCFISEGKKRGNDKILQLCLFIKNRFFKKLLSHFGKIELKLNYHQVHEFLLPYHNT